MSRDASQVTRTPLATAVRCFTAKSEMRSTLLGCRRIVRKPMRVILFIVHLPDTQGPAAGGRE